MKNQTYFHGKINIALESPLFQITISIRTQVKQGTKNVRQHWRALEYFKDTLFLGESDPDATRRKFRPNCQKIRNSISSVRN